MTAPQNPFKFDADSPDSFSANEPVDAFAADSQIAAGVSAPGSIAPFGAWPSAFGWGAGAMFGQGGFSPSAPSVTTHAPAGQVLAATQTVSTSGSGLVFVNTYDSTDTAAFKACILAAEKTLESLFTNKVTLRLSFSEVNNGATGYAFHNNWSSSTVVTYAALRAKLPGGDSLPATDPDPIGGKDFSIPEAYARMLGLATATPTVDDNVQVNIGYKWKFGQDVINGLIHEISEGGMGRTGALGNGAKGYFAAMDLFRYSAPGVHDYTDGRDGKTTYFSSDGINLSSAAGLPFNNNYNSSGVKVNGGDSDDWHHPAVFGGTGSGETLTLVQTELDVLKALGWHVALPQDIFTATSADWQTPTDWSNGSMPITPEDAFIGVLNNATATSKAAVTVNSIGTNLYSALVVAGNSKFTATNGTVLNRETTYSFASGNIGKIEVDVGSSLTIGNAFDNRGALDVGVILSSAGGSGALTLNGTVKFSGGGALNLGDSAFQTFSDGDVSGGGLVNVDNTIAGAGSIVLASFDNQAHGKLEATQSEGDTLLIDANTFKNEGAIVAQSRATIGFGKDGATRSLTNSGTISLDGGDLAISGTFDIVGAGSLRMNGGGADIVSDGVAATLTNGSSITATASGQIGDAGVLGANHLAFDNSGSTIASGSGVTLTLSTGGNAIEDGGGLLEAKSGATLAIDSAVDTGEVRLLGFPPPPGGTIEAGAGGTVTLAAAVADGLPPFEISVSGQIQIAGGVFDMLSGASVDVPIDFTASNSELKLAAPSALKGDVSGFDTTGTGDKIDVTGAFTYAGFTENAGGTQGTLNFMSGGASSHITLAGDYVASKFVDNSGVITYT